MAVLIADAMEKMIAFSQGNLHDVEHFMKVHAFAGMIGALEGLDAGMQQTLELAAIVHDIACPLCRKKYGNTDGKKQELESPPLVEAFFDGLPVSQETVRRVSWLTAHHPTYTGVDGPDHRILLEADYLVNAGENGYSEQAVRAALEHIFETASGKRLLRSLYLFSERGSGQDGSPRASNII